MSLEHSPARGSGQGQRLTTTEAAKYLGISASTLSKLRVFGVGPSYYKLSRRVVYDTRTLDAYLQARVHNNTSSAANPAT